MTERREQWLRTLRHPHQSFPARFPAPARRLQESRTWPRHGTTARIASTVVNTARRRKEEKEEGELSSSDDDGSPPLRKSREPILGKGRGSNYESPSLTTGKEQQHRREDSAPVLDSTSAQPALKSSFVNKSQLLSAISAQAPPLSTNRATVAVEKIPSELAAKSATSSGLGISTVVPDARVQNLVHQQVQHIKSKIVSQPAQSEPKLAPQPAQHSVSSKDIFIINPGKKHLDKGEPAQNIHLTTRSASSNSKAGATDIEKPSVPAFGQSVNQGKQPENENAIVPNGPPATDVGPLLSPAVLPVSSFVPTTSSSALAVKAPLVVSVAAPPPSFIPLLPAVGYQASDEARSLPAQGSASAFSNAVAGSQASAEGKSQPLQGAASASQNPAGITLPSVVPARKEAESFLASLRIPLAPTAMCSLPAVEDKEEAFVINFDDSSESDVENRLVGAGFNRNNIKAAARTGNQPVQGISAPAVQQGSNGGGVQKPAILQSQIDQMKKQIAAMEQKGKPPVAPNSSKPYKTLHSALHRQPQYASAPSNGDGDKLESLRQTILQKENELEKERQRLGNISHATRRSAPMIIVTPAAVGKSSNASVQMNSQKFRDANAGNSGSTQGRVGVPYPTMSGGYAAYTSTGGQSGPLKSLNPPDFELRGPAGNLFTPWVSQNATTAPRLTSSGLPLSKSTVAAKQKRARAEKLAYDIKRLEAQIGSAKGKAVGSPKVHQSQKRKQGATNLFDNGFVNQVSSVRTDSKRHRSITSDREAYVPEDHLPKYQIGTADQSLWTSPSDMLDRRNVATSRYANPGQIGDPFGEPNSNIRAARSALQPTEKEPNQANASTHVSGQGLVGLAVRPSTSEGLKRRTHGMRYVLEGEALHSVPSNRRSAVRGEESYCPKPLLPTESVSVETVFPGRRAVQVQQRETPYSQMLLDANADGHAVSPELPNSPIGQVIGTLRDTVNILQYEQQSHSVGRNVTDLNAEAGHPHRQEDSVYFLEDLVDKELEEAQERRRVCEAQERTARRAYREAQHALQAINSHCDYLHQKREKVAAQVRAAEIQHYSARALVQPPRFSNEDTFVSFDKDMSGKAPFFYSAPSTWTRAEPTTHQVAVLLPRMGSMVNHQFSGHEDMHCDESHESYEGSRVARETRGQQPLGATNLNDQAADVRNEVRSSDRTYEAHAVAQNIGPMIQRTITARNYDAGVGNSAIAGRKQATDSSTLQRPTMPDAITDLPQNILSTSQLLSTIAAEPRVPPLRSRKQVKSSTGGPSLLSGRKASQPSPASDPDLLRIVEPPGRQEKQGSARESEVEELAMVPIHTGTAVVDQQCEVSPPAEQTIPNDGLGSNTSALPEEPPSLPDNDLVRSSPYTHSLDKAMHVNRKVKKRTRQQGGRAFHRVKARKVTPQKFRSVDYRESPGGFKLPSAPDENDSPASRASDHAPAPSVSIMTSSPAADIVCKESPLVGEQYEHLYNDSQSTPGGNHVDIDTQSEKPDEITCSIHAKSAPQQPVSGPDEQPCQSSLEAVSGGVDDIRANVNEEAEPVVDAFPIQEIREQVDAICLSTLQHVDSAPEALDHVVETSEHDDPIVEAGGHEKMDVQIECAQQNFVEALPQESTLTHASASESRNLDFEFFTAGVGNILYEQELSLRTTVVSDKQGDDGDAREDDASPSLEDSDLKEPDMTDVNIGSSKVPETSCGTQVLEDDILMGSSASTEMLAGHASDAFIENAKQQNISEVDPATSDYLVISTFKGDLDLYVPSSTLIITFSCLTPGDNLALLDCAKAKVHLNPGKALRKSSLVPLHQQPWYTSPLSNFRSYRLFPWFNHSLESSTWSNSIDCFRPLCKFEHRGVCKDQECPLQHIRDYTMDLSQIVSQLHEYFDAKMSDVSSISQRNTRCIQGSVEDHADSDINPYAEAYLIVAEAQKMGFSIMKPPRCENWKWASYVGRAPAYRMGSNVYRTEDTVLKAPVVSRALPFSTLGAFQSYLLSPCASRPLPVNVPFLFEVGEKKGLFEKLVINTPRWSDLADGSEKQALAEGEPNDVELWLEVALDLINFDVNVEELDKKASALFLLSRALEANSSSAVLWIVYLSIFYTKNGTEKDDLFKPAVDHSNCYELWRLFIDTRPELNERLESYESALLRLGSLDDSSLGKKNSSYLLDLALQMLYCMIISGKIEMALSWIDNLVLDASADSAPPIRSSTSAVLTGLTLHDACILWVCCAYISAYSHLPSNIVTRFGCRQELPLDLQWTSQQLEPVDRMTRLLKTAASTGLGCLSLDTNNVSDDEANHSRQAFAVNYVQCLAVSLGVDAAVSYCQHFLTLYPSCLELVVTCARFEQQLRGTQQGLGVFHDAVIKLQGTSGVHRLWNQYEGHALRWGGKDAALDVLARCGACEHHGSNPKAGSSSSSISDSTVDAETKRIGDRQQSRACLSAIAQRHLSSWVENAKGNRILPGQDSVFSLLNLGLFEALCGETAAAQVAIERALKVASNDKDAEHCWKDLASFTIFSWGQESETGDSCLLGQHMLDLLDRCFTESRLISNLESLSQLADTIKKRRVRSFVKNLLGSNPRSYFLLNDILYATYGPTMLPGTSTSFQRAASFAEGILEIMPGNVVVALALCRLIAKVYDKSTSVSADAASVWASSLVAQSLVKSSPPAPEMQWVEAANFLRKIGEPKALEEFCQHALQVYPFSVELGKLLEASWQGALILET